eukprot:CAMPEP_0178437840 /NCGR_PEP_ID=MMETSP0689_2-20121128/35230_1 /TAXON_ID=160604 /ORGANISM="Amphidinium massartii, Strain CS-259" /LENGTH=290 /DNA_ID=CAMNT_0020060115 /DNA_START=131 /DNA_END=1000 /DNA_ORIENTATION=+
MDTTKYDQRQTDATEQDVPVHVYLGLIVSFVTGMLGGLAGGYLGWVVQDGVFTIATASLGFVVCFCVAAACTGPLSYVKGQVSATMIPPDATRLKTTGFTSWDLYVTVHLVKNLYVSEGMLGWMVGATNDSYVELKVGRFIEPDTFKLDQPVKYTCVSKTHTFEESFHFLVSPTDDHLRITLWDQDMFSDDLVGLCDININEQILLGGFPQHKAFRLVRARMNPDDAYDVDHLAGTIVLSFRPGGAFPQSVYNKLSTQKPLHYKQMKSESESLFNSMNKAGAYGTWAMST